MEKKERIIWIDGLKYFACIGVFLSHFLGTFIFDKAFAEFGSPMIIKNVFGFFSVLTNGNFWVCVFCIISGMFSSAKAIDSIKKLIKEVFLRYIRFVIPFIFMCFFIRIIDMTAGFRTQEMGELFSNDWLMMFYPNKVTVSELIKCIFFFDNSCNYVLWTIAPIFIGNLIIYAFDFLLNKFKLTDNLRSLIELAFILVFSIVCIALKSTLIYSCACCLGVIIPKAAQLLKKIPTEICTFVFITTITVFHFHNRIIDFLIPRISFIETVGSDLFYLNTIWHILYAVILIVLIYKLSFVQKFFSLKFFRKFSFTSFSVYIFHCPVIFSLSLLFCSMLMRYLSYTAAFFLTLILTSIFIFFWSIAYEKSIGKLCTVIIKRIKDLIKV